MKRTLIYVMMILVLAMAGLAEVSAQEYRRENRRGNRAFAKGDFDKAVGHYEKSLAKDTVNTLPLIYNMAYVLHSDRRDSTKNALKDSLALKHLDKIAEKVKGTEYEYDYHFTKGVIAIDMKDWQKAVDEFKQCLLMDPEDMDARENYIYAKEHLQKDDGGSGGGGGQDQQHTLLAGGDEPHYPARAVAHGRQRACARTAGCIRAAGRRHGGDDGKAARHDGNGRGRARREKRYARAAGSHDTLFGGEAAQKDDPRAAACPRGKVRRDDVFRGRRGGRMINRYLGNSGQVERLPQPGNRPASAHPAPRQNTTKRNTPKREESPRQAPPPREVSAPSGTRPAGQRSSGGIRKQPAGVSGQGKAGGYLTDSAQTPAFCLCQ